MKRLRKGLCLLLTVALLCAAVPFSVQGANCTCDAVPRIWVPGIGGVLLDENGAELPIAKIGDDLQDKILSLVGSIFSSAFTRKWDKAADEFSALAWDMFGHLAVDLEGNSVEKITPNPSINAAQNHKNVGSYSFVYDWRLSPITLAAQLHDYIEQVKIGSGHSKVKLYAHSEGGVVTMAYLAEYGYDSLEDLVLVMSAHNGLTMVGELFNLNLDVTSKSVMKFIRSYLPVFGAEGAMELLGPGLELLKNLGFVDVLVAILSCLLKRVQDKVFADAMIPLFVQWPALWGFVPDEYYESAKATLLNDPKFDSFKALIDKHHYSAGAGKKADELILGAVDAGVEVCIVTSYGYSGMPFTKNAGYDTDGLIDTARESSGAITAGYGKNFKSSYQQEKDDGHAHVSPDRKIDASTCLLPEQTWFLREQQHFVLDFPQFLYKLTDSDEQVTVHTYEDCPQFLTVVSPGEFTPTKYVEDAKGTCLVQSLWNFLKVSMSLLCQAIQVKINESSEPETLPAAGETQPPQAETTLPEQETQPPTEAETTQPAAETTQPAATETTQPEDTEELI